jgi:hypothetical protein
VQTTKTSRKRRKGPNSFGEKISTWEALSTAAKPHLTENPQAAADQSAFEAVIGQVKILAAEEESLTAQLRDANKSRQAAENQGKRLRHHLVSHLKSKFGPDNEMLREFGLRPQGRRVRRKSAAGAPTTDPQPTPPPASGTPESHKP